MTEKILFATPAYGNMVTAAYCRSCLIVMEELTRVGLANDWIIPQNNDSLVHRARMKIAKTFLDRKEFSHLGYRHPESRKLQRAELKLFFEECFGGISPIDINQCFGTQIGGIQPILAGFKLHKNNGIFNSFAF